MRSFLSSPLVVVGKGIELTRNRSVGHGLGSAEQSPCCLKIFLTSLQPHARPSRPVCVLLNNQATDRLIGKGLLKLPLPFGLGSCPKVNHDADDADRVPEGAQRIRSRAHGATGLDPERASSNISDFYYYAERQPPWLSRRARRQGVRQQIRSNSEQKTPREYK